MPRRLEMDQGSPLRLLLVNYGRRTSETDEEWEEIVRPPRRACAIRSWPTGRACWPTGAVIWKAARIRRFPLPSRRPRARRATAPAMITPIRLTSASGRWACREHQRRRARRLRLPRTTHSLSHNVVSWIARNVQTYAWISQIADMDKVQYLRPRRRIRRNSAVRWR